MSRRTEAISPVFRLATPWLGVALALTLAIGAGILLADILMSPTASELRSLGTYLTLTGAGTMGVGWLALKGVDRALGLTIRIRAFLSSIIAGGVALLNVIIVAELMFVSTSHDLKLLVALVAFSAVVTLFFSLWVATAVSGRVSAVAAVVRSLARGDLTVRAENSGADEVAQLARDVNTLAIRLQQSEEQRTALDRERRELTIAVSHDLRTPLASIRAMVEALDDRLIDEPKEVQRYYGTMRREIERLNLMIDDLFELAQMDAGALRLERRSVALQEIASDVVDAMQAQARQQAVALNLKIDGEPPELLIDGGRIERAVSNLLRNALEHTSEGGRIDVGVAADIGCVELSVSDTGAGIEESDLPHIWGRFYRAEKSRNRGAGSNGGAGLGLTIVRGIIEAHDGTVSAVSSRGKGSTFVVRLPVTKQ